MNRILFILVLLIALIGLPWFFFSKNTPETITNDSPVSSSSSVSVDVFGDNKSLDSQKFTNSKDSISFQEIIAEPNLQGKNPTWKALVNDKFIGEVSGLSFSQFSFSPDNKYFAFKAILVGGCAGRCHTFIIYVINLEKKEIIEISSPRKSNEYSGPEKEDGFPISGFIESYNWNGDSLEVISYFIAFIKNEETKQGDYIRLSPKETWQFDLLSKKYKANFL
jgi:hypothetical protein